MTSVFDISAFEANGWVFRLCNDKVLGTPPPGSPPDALATLRPHREAIRKALFGRGGVTVGDLYHDACVIFDRDHSDMTIALDGAAISHGFASWADAKRKLSTAA